MTFDSFTVTWDAAQASLARRDLIAAERHLEHALHLRPEYVPARILLSGAYLARGFLRAATSQLLQCNDLPIHEAGILLRLAQALVRVGEPTAARACLCRPLVASCRDGATLAALAHVHQILGQHASALATMERAQTAGFDNPDFRYFKSIQLQFNGRLEEAEEELEACLRRGPTHGRASLTLARLRRQTTQHNHLGFIQDQLVRVPAGSEDHAAFEFAQYKELEDLGHYELAWKSLQRGNEVMSRRLAYDACAERRIYEALISECDAEFLRPLRAAPEGAIPIFIIGLPRSGTTVLDRVLGNHSQIESAGELSDFAHQLRWQADHVGRTLLDERLVGMLRDLDYGEVGRRYLERTQWRAAGKRFFIDKLPANFMLAGLIGKALPQAVILHLRRDSMDVCFSNYRALFGDAYAYSYDLVSLASHYESYLALTAHWNRVMPGRILDVRYETLVSCPEESVCRILAHIGLDNEAGCTDLSRNVSPSATLSSAQVRQSIHARDMGKWRRYEPQLRTLELAIAGQTLHQE